MNEEVKINLIWATVIILIIGGIIFGLFYSSLQETDYKKCADKCSMNIHIDERQNCYDTCLVHKSCLEYKDDALAVTDEEVKE